MTETISNEPGALTPKEPSVAEKLQMEYNQLCTLIGHLGTQIKTKEKQKQKAEEKLEKVVNKAANLPKPAMEEVAKNTITEDQLIEEALGEQSVAS